MRWAWIFLATLYGIIFLAHTLVVGKTVYGDGIYYYSWLRSIVVDKNIDFTNEYQHFGVQEPVTPIGLSRNKHAIGPALFWLGPFQWAHALIRKQGYELPYQLIVGSVSVIFSLLGLFILYRLLNKYFSPEASLLSVIATATATNLLYYGAVDPVNSHSVSFFVISLYIYVVVCQPKHSFFSGLLLGLSAITRPQDILFALLLLHARNTIRIMPLITGFIIGIAPQLIAWKLLFGTALISPYLAGGESFSFLSPKIFSVLFSPESGLLLWTPIVIVALFGLIGWKPSISRVMLTIFVGHLYIVASWSTWWQGASYSGRMFVSSLPLLAFGLANVFSYIKNRSIAGVFVSIFALLNAASVYYFLAATG